MSSRKTCDYYGYQFDKESAETVKKIKEEEKGEPLSSSELETLEASFYTFGKCDKPAKPDDNKCLECKETFSFCLSHMVLHTLVCRYKPDDLKDFVKLVSDSVRDESTAATTASQNARKRKPEPLSTEDKRPKPVVIDVDAFDLGRPPVSVLSMESPAPPRAGRPRPAVVASNNRRRRRPIANSPTKVSVTSGKTKVSVQVEKEDKDEEEKVGSFPTCPVCLDRDANHALPCGHLLCGTCTSIMSGHGDREITPLESALIAIKCPICKKLAVRAVKLFM